MLCLKCWMNQPKLKQQRIRFTCPFCLLVFENMKSHRWVRPDMCPSSASACLEKIDIYAPPGVPPATVIAFLTASSQNELSDFSFFLFCSCILADVHCTQHHHKTCFKGQLHCCQFILPCLQNICGNILLLLNISVTWCLTPRTW